MLYIRLNGARLVCDKLKTWPRPRSLSYRALEIRYRYIHIQRDREIKSERKREK